MNYSDTIGDGSSCGKPFSSCAGNAAGAEKNGGMSRAFVVLGLGSNRPYDLLLPKQLLEHACGLLASGISELRCSSVYRTRPMYYAGQDDFYNMAVSGFFTGTPRDLLDFIHEVEARFGRNRSAEFRNGPRPLDIDIELFGNVRVTEPDLQIPHPRLTERAFVLIPMLEILKESAESIDKAFYAECLRKLPDQGVRLDSSV